MKISILTATYNRANLLPRLYESIRNQNRTGIQIEWLIMDDGSSDHTKEIVSQWECENALEIHYYWQENAGKMAAINHLMEFVTGEVIIEMDSDDYFLPDTFQIIKEDYKNLDKDVYGVLYRNEIVGQKIMEKFPFEGEIKKLFDLHYRYNLKFDMMITFKAEIRKQFSYPLVEQERFITEAFLYYQMEEQYKGLLIKSNPMRVCEYQADGYSKNIRTIFEKYPKGYFQYFQYLVNHSMEHVTLKNRLYFMKHYILFSVLNNKGFCKSYQELQTKTAKLFYSLFYLPGKWKTDRMFPRKKLLFTAYNLSLGGIETALVSLLKSLDLTKLDVTLILEKKEGAFLNDIDSRIRVKEYRISNSKNVLFRKVWNRMKLILWVLTHYHKYHTSVSYATYSIPGGLLALKGSRNNVLWVHNNYLRIMNGKEEKLRSYCQKLKFSKYQKIVFVSNENKEDLTRICTEYKEKSIVCNNFIDGEKIINLSNEEISMKKEKTTFINVGRHDENQKKITRILEASEKLKEFYDFEVWLVGEGPETKKYQEIVEQKGLKEIVKFLGFQKNPYAYMKKSDALLLSSEYEGYPVVFIEAMILDLPIVSTKVSDYHSLENRYGIFKENSESGVYEAMKEFLKNGFQVKEKFDYQQFNEAIKQKLEQILNIEEDKK